MAYLYRHIRLDTNEVFYIGIGSDEEGYYERAVVKNSKVRNRFWSNIVNKTNYEVEIVLDNLTWEEVRIKETEFIALYGRRNLGKGTLVNLTDGGDGSVGLTMSKEARSAISKGNKGKKRTEACKKARSILYTGRTLSANQVVKMGVAQQSRWKEWKRLGKLPKSARMVLDLTTGIFYDSVVQCYTANNITRNSMCKRMKSGKRFIYV